MNARPEEEAPTPPPVEERGERWVTCARFDSWSASRFRHRIAKKRGTETTLCGCTALPASIWRGNKTKPVCPTCETLALSPTTSSKGTTS